MRWNIIVECVGEDGHNRRLRWAQSNARREYDCGKPVFAVLRDQDGHAKQHVQALLRQSGRSLETKLRVVSDGEDGMRSLVGKLFNANEQHILDWYHIARRFEAIGKGLVYLPHVEDFEHRLSRHWHHLNRVKWKVWYGNLYGASIALSSFYDGVDIHV